MQRSIGVGVAGDLGALAGKILQIGVIGLVAIEENVRLSEEVQQDLSVAGLFDLSSKATTNDSEIGRHTS
jgi:hypothetical protein